MLKTVRDACEPHKVAFDFSPNEQVEDLAQVLDGKADGRAFYAKNHITAGMRQLFELGLKRLAGKNDQAIFELTQAMGGARPTPWWRSGFWLGTSHSAPRSFPR